MTSAGSGKDSFQIYYLKHVPRQHLALLWVSSWSLDTSLAWLLSGHHYMMYLGCLEASMAEPLWPARWVLGFQGVGVGLACWRGWGLSQGTWWGNIGWDEMIVVARSWKEAAWNFFRFFTIKYTSWLWANWTISVYILKDFFFLKDLVIIRWQ